MTKTLKKNNVVLVKVGKSNKLAEAKIERVNGNKVYVRYISNDIIKNFGNDIFEYSNKDIQMKNKSNIKNGSNIKNILENQIIEEPDNNIENQEINEPNVVNSNSEISNIKSNRIEPLFWVLPNKKKFQEWITKTFIKYRLDGKPPKKSSKFEPFKYQKFLRDYMQSSSPYRGILLYHGLGSGKTCTSVIIAENLKKGRNIVVMLPASLRSNYKSQAISGCGIEDYIDNPESFDDRYSFISYNASNTLTQLKRLGNLDNKVIIIDEVHNLISRLVSGIMGVSKQGKEIYELLMEAKNCKIIALSGTPVVNDPFEMAVLFNILRGYIEITYFRILEVDNSLGNRWDFENLENELATVDFVDYININKVNRSIEVHTTVKSWTDTYKELTFEIVNICKRNGVVAKYLEKKEFTLFPIDSDEKDFRQYFVNDLGKDGDRLKNIDVFKNRIMGLVSYYIPLESNYPDLLENEVERIPMSTHQYQIYTILRDKERKGDRVAARSRSGSKRKKGGFRGTFRMLTREASNFTFPDEIPRPYKDPKFIITTKKKNKNNDSNQIIQKVVQTEEKANNGELSKDYKRRIDKAIKELIENADLYLKSGPEGLDKLSPKMKLILENINKSEGLVFVYSNFRVLEGVEIFSRILDVNGYAKYDTDKDLPKYAIYSGSEKEDERHKILNIFNNNENKYGKNLKIILATSAGAEGLNLKNVRQVHIMDPYWNQNKKKQVIGRAVRRNSHIELKSNERNVTVFEYLSVIPEEDKHMSKDKLSTDEYILDVSYKKQLIIDDITNVMKEAAVDCVLNALDIKGDYDCLTFGSNAEGQSYLPKVRKDIVYSHSFGNITVTKKKELVVAGIYRKKIYIPDKKAKKLYLYHNKEKSIPAKINPKKLKPIMVDLSTGNVYDFKSVKAKKPIKIGKIGNNSSFKK